MTQYGFYIDTSRCIGCHACAHACKQWHDIEPGPAKPLRVHQWEGGSFPDIKLNVMPLMCFHCENPACLDACDHDAIYKEDKYGAVLVDVAKCQGDRKCYAACPYGTPQFKSDAPKEKMLKCTMCYDRLEAGDLPICVLACSMRALDFGKLDDLREKYGDSGSFIAKTSPPCKNACPAGVDAQAYINLVEEGKYSDALAKYYEITPFAGVLGRVCTHACEIDCMRGRFDNAVAIREIKLHMADYAKEHGLEPKISIADKSPQKIAVVGSGPSGLACAYTLAQKGYAVTVLEKQPKAGGMLRYAIPEFRLPREVLDYEIDFIKNLGVDIKTNSSVANTDGLLKDFDAVYVATGTWQGIPLGVKGEDAQNLISAIDFLRNYHQNGTNPVKDKRVVVIGGGSVSLDSARLALRMGAKYVEIIMLETLDFKHRDRIVAQDVEVQDAQAEGVVFTASKGVREISVKDGTAYKVVCKDCLQVRDEEGRFAPLYNDDLACQPYETKADVVITAIGQKADREIFSNYALSTLHYALKEAPAGIFVGGDCVTGPKDIITAVAHGNEGAESIHRYLTGQDIAENRRVIPNSIRPRLEKPSQPKPDCSRCLKCGSIVPSALIKREQPKKTIVPYSFGNALKLWQVRQPESGENLPLVFTDWDAVTNQPLAEMTGRNRLVLKPANSEEKMFFTTDDE